MSFDIDTYKRYRDPTTGETYLARHAYDDELLVDDHPTLTTAEIVQVLADDAENWNWHEFVDLYPWLATTVATIARRYVTPETADEMAQDFMQEIAKHGGLHGR